MQQIQFQVSGASDITSVPRIAQSIEGQRRLGGSSKVVTIKLRDWIRKRSRIRVAVFLLISTLLFLRCRVFSKRFVSVGTWRGAAQEKVNRRGDRLDVAVFLSSYVADEIVERSVFLASAKVKRRKDV